ncbi:MAG: phosphoglycerate kinase [Planctomycetes bacterium]|nr:phosphoglycerate kinase [Planctomycetota bacterium]
MAKRSIHGLEVEGRRVLVRADFNVPLNDRGQITDDGRIRATLPTLEHLLGRSGRLILMSHLGRPDGRRVERYGLRPVAVRLRELLGRPVELLPDCVGPGVEARVDALRPGEVVLLENLRFHAGEEANDPGFASGLARLGEAYVNDAFGAAHRAHASVSTAITSKLPSAAGLLMARELEYLGLALKNPPRPFYALLGGAKISDKIGVVRNLMDRVDGLLVGGGMSNTFHRALGRPMGVSLVDEKSQALSLQLLETARMKGVEFLLPADYLVAERGPQAKAEVRLAEMPDPGVPAGWAAVDIGPKTRTQFLERLALARCILWNGPVGVYEVPAFAEGTRVLAEAISGLTDRGTVTILGGGDTAAAATRAGLTRFSHVSTGGGASLEFLGGVELPGVAALPDAD